MTSSDAAPRASLYRSIIDYIVRCTSPHARLLTLTFAPELFFFTGRRSWSGSRTGDLRALG